MTFPLLVFSPHLDDTVLSCGQLLATHRGSTVCTVFTAPARHDQLTDWDRASGFTSALEATDARKAEDRRALATLGARPLHLPFCDSQYGSTPTQASLLEAFSDILQDLKPRTVLFPLGLFHSDHILVADVLLALLQQRNADNFIAYEDVPYRRMEGAVQNRLADLAMRGYVATRSDCLDASADSHADSGQKKRSAIHEYESQLRAFGPDVRDALFSSEHYWHLQFSASQTDTAEY
ncbi:MAG: No significant database matches [uncultured Paraburkholderia sp.]|nr:MAG: No significant database matches [uncultured Paraburkholderia sp.]CAH2938654.1 MAG: No significant database matches [uncultured Paraburkholderia sp.]